MVRQAIGSGEGMGNREWGTGANMATPETHSRDLQLPIPCSPLPPIPIQLSKQMRAAAPGSLFP